MTLEEVLELLDGNGLVITDLDLIMDTLSSAGYAVFDLLVRNDSKAMEE